MDIFLIFMPDITVAESHLLKLRAFSKLYLVCNAINTYLRVKYCVICVSMV